MRLMRFAQGDVAFSLLERKHVWRRIHERGRSDTQRRQMMHASPQTPTWQARMEIDVGLLSQ